MSEKKYNKNSLQWYRVCITVSNLFQSGRSADQIDSVEFVVDQHGAKRFIIYSDICLSENTGRKFVLTKWCCLERF